MGDLYAHPTLTNRPAQPTAAHPVPTESRRKRRKVMPEELRRKDVIQRAGMLIDDAAIVIQRLLSGGEPDPAAASVACMLASKIEALNEARTIAMDPEFGDLDDAQRVVETLEETRIRTGGSL